LVGALGDRQRAARVGSLGFTQAPITDAFSSADPEKPDNVDYEKSLNFAG
jgi:hypothetical protein